MQDFTKVNRLGTQVSLYEVVTDSITDTSFDNPFVRFNKAIQKYPHFHDDMDDITMFETDNFERFKQYNAKPGTTVGESPIFPIEDNDQKFQFYDIQGESIYTNPPDSDAPAIDHKLDEDQIWAFRRSAYNQSIVVNQYLRNAWEATTWDYAPQWGSKLMTDAFFNEESEKKFFFQWKLRYGLEAIKMKQAIETLAGDKDQMQQHKDEIAEYVAFAETENQKYDMGEVYVTDHQPRERKVLTLNKDEDEKLFNYYKAVQEYNDTPSENYK